MLWVQIKEQFIWHCVPYVQQTIDSFGVQSCPELLLAIRHNVKWNHAIFTGATLIVSTIFAVVGCLSFSPSVTLVDCMRTPEDIVKLLSRPGSPITLVFDPMRRNPIPRGTLQRGRKIHMGWEKLDIFQLKWPFI